MNSLNIVVMLGGPSREREVSLRSGKAVANALRSLGHTVHEIDPHPNNLWKRELPADTDVVFLALHGTYGEDGTIQQELDKLKIPYTGCDAKSSSIAFDKKETKELLKKHNIPTPKWEVIKSVNDPWPAHLRPPCVLKPVHQGSSVGLYFIDRVDQLGPAVQADLQFDHELLLEERIIGRETTVGILGDSALPVVEIKPRQGEYDYKHKYTVGATDYECPADFDERITKDIQEAGLRAFRAIGGRDYGRVDVMVRANGEPVVLEVNTLPGMTETSLLPKAAAAPGAKDSFPYEAKVAGYTYEELCQIMVELALRRFPNGIVQSK